MNYLYRLLSWLLGITIVFCILLFGWRVLLNQSREESDNQYEYNIDRYRTVDPSLIHYFETKSIALSADGFHAVATDNNGNIYASIDSQIEVYSQAGEKISSLELTSPCYAIAVGSTGTIYLAMKEHIEIYSKDLVRISQLGEMGTKAQFSSIAVSENHIYAADSGNRVVWQFEADGKLLGNIPPREKNSDGKHFIVPSPYFDVALTPADPEKVWIANPGRSRVELFDSNAKAIAQWGKPGMSIKEFSGCCNPSHIAITPEGNIATAEKGLPRVRIFSPDGRLLSVVAAPLSFNKTPQGCYSEALLKDIAVDADGRVLVLDRETRSIRIFIKRNIQ